MGKISVVCEDDCAIASFSSWEMKGFLDYVCILFFEMILNVPSLVPSAPARDNRFMDRISRVLPQVLQKRGLAEHASSAHITYCASQWLADAFPDFQAILTVRSYKDGTLFIECSHSIALQECQAKLPDLRTYLALECPLTPVSDVRIARS